VAGGDRRLAHLRCKASEKKWPEARSWCERRRFNKGYVLRKKGKPDPTPARAEKRTAARFYVPLKSGRVPEDTDNRPDDHCWWCDPENISGTQQTRGHLFKHCSMWKDQQAELWARVKEATERAKRKWRVGDLLADERCSPAVLETWDSEDEGDGAVGAGPEAEGGGGLWSSDPRARFSLLFLLLLVITVFTVLFMLLLSGGRGRGAATREVLLGAVNYNYNY